MIGSCWVRMWFPCSYLLCTIMSVPLAGVGAVVGGLVAPLLSKGLHVSLGQGESTSRGSNAPVLTLPGPGEAEIVPDRA
jgi:hypothetical protein